MYWGKIKDESCLGEMKILTFPYLVWIGLNKILPLWNYGEMQKILHYGI